MNKEELLYNEIYERTKDFGRTQFIREMMRLQRENKELQQKVNQLETNISTAIDFIDIYTDGINLEAFDCLELMYKVKEILERGKE